MNLHIDDAAFIQAKNDYVAKSTELNELKMSIKDSFEQLKSSWDSAASKIFFERFEDELLNNLEDYSKVFQRLSENVKYASTESKFIFEAANDVVNCTEENQ